MKIKKTPPKRLSPPTPAIKEWIDKLTECPESEFIATINTFNEWPWQKSDFFHWIPVLNRFDTLLEECITKYDLKAIQKRPYTADDKALVMAVLKFARILWDNCINRNLYSSYEHLSDLLHTTDLDVLDALLRLLLRPASRFASQRSLRNNLVTLQDKLLVLAHNFGTKEYGIDLPQLASETVTIPPECAVVNYNFYRAQSQIGSLSALPNTQGSQAPVPSTPSAAAAASSSNLPPLAPPPSSSTHATPVAGKKRKLDATNTNATTTPAQTPVAVKSPTTAEGMVVVHIPTGNVTKSDVELFYEAVQAHDIPAEHQFNVFHRIRVAKGLAQTKSRRKLLVLRLLALAAVTCVVSEDILNSKIFLYEPELIARLADLLQTDKEIPIDIQIASLNALDSIAHIRSKLTELLGAVNASANHGILMYVLRKVITALNSDQPDVPQEYIEAVFSLVSFLITAQNGGVAVISAGIIQTLVPVIKNKTPGQSKHVIKCITILDNIIYGFTNSFSPFVNANGLEILVERIKEEVDGVLAEKPTPMETEPTSSNTGASSAMSLSSSTASASVPTSSSSSLEISYEKSQFIRSMLKFIMHMMQVSGTADRMRNLIDSSLPSSLVKIFENVKIFGAGVFGIAVNIMSTFIHNEPTSLSILQESKVPQAFFTAVADDFAVTAEVISAIPNAFGALCLNQQGLDTFNEAKPIEKFLSIFLDQENLKHLADNDVPTVVGSSVDELMRHHPSLKTDVMSGIIDMLKKLVKLAEKTPNDDGTALLTKKVVPTGADVNVTDANGAASLLAPPALTTPDVNTPVRDVEMVDARRDGDDETNRHGSSSKDSDKKEHPILMVMDVVCRFIEGIFQNTAQVKEFVRLDGVQVLFDLMGIETIPFDYSTAGMSYSMSYLFRMLVEANSQVVCQALVKELKRVIGNISSFLDTTNRESIIAKYVDFTNLSESEMTASATLSEGNALFRSMIVLSGLTRLLSDIFFSHVMGPGKSFQALIQTFSGEEGEELLLLLGKLHRVCIWENIGLKLSVPKAWYSTKSKKDAKANANSVKSPISVSGFRQESTESLGSNPLIAGASSSSSSGMLAGASATDSNEPIEEADPNDPRVRNTRMWKFLLTHTPQVLTPTFQGIVAAVASSRRNIDAVQKKQALKIMDVMGTLFKDHLSWPRVLDKGKATEGDSTSSMPPKAASHLYHYLSIVFTFVSMMIIDERNSMSLQTYMVLAMDRTGCIDVLVDWLQKIWQQLHPYPDVESVKTDEEKDVARRTISCLEILCTNFQYLTSTRMLMESVHTSRLISRTERDKTSLEYFDRYDFVINMYLRVMPVVSTIWRDAEFRKTQPIVIRSVVAIIMSFLKAELTAEGATPTGTSNAAGSAALGGTGSASAGAAAALSIPGLGGVAGGASLEEGGLHRLSAFADALFHDIRDTRRQLGTGRDTASSGSGSGTGSAASRPAAPAFVPDATAVASLMDMGFPRRACEIALQRCRNGLERAAEYLLTHPDVVEQGAREEQQQQQQEQQGQSSSSSAPAASGSGSNDNEMTTAAPAPAPAPAPASTSENETSSTTPAANVNEPSSQAPAVDAAGDTEMGDVDVEAVDDASRATGPGENENNEEPENDDDYEDIDEDEEENEDEDDYDDEEMDDGTWGEARTLARALALSFGVQLGPEPSDRSKSKIKDNKKTEEDLKKRQQVEKIREDLKKDVIECALLLLDSIVDELVFDIKDLIMLAGKDDMENVCKMVVADIDRLRKITGDDKISVKLSRKFRLFALLANDPALQKKAVHAAEGFISDLLKMVIEEDVTSGKLADWLSPALLTVESYLSVSEEPETEELKVEVDDMPLIPKETDTTKRPEPLSIAQRTAFIGRLVSILKMETVDKDVLNAVLRLCVRLTRSNGVALEFVKHGGIPALFRADRIANFAGQQQLTLLLVRHIVEDPNVLQHAMEREIRIWFDTGSRPRATDISSFVRNRAQLVCRDTDAFIKATAAACKLQRVDHAHVGKKFHIAIRRTDKNETAPAAEGATAAKKDTSNEVLPTVSSSTSAMSRDEGTLEYTSSFRSGTGDHSENVVQYLIAELMSLKHTPVSSTESVATPAPEPSSSSEKGKEKATGMSLSEIDTSQKDTPQSSTEAEKVPEKVFTSEETAAHVRRCFLLQCLAELVASYTSCKFDVINASQRKGKSSVHRSRNSFLNHLLHDLLPLSSLTEPPKPPGTNNSNNNNNGDANTERGRRKMESYWASTLLIGLCSNGATSAFSSYTPDTKEAKTEDADLLTVQKLVVDAIGKALKDASHSMEHVEIKYGRFVALADLCTKISLASLMPTNSNPFVGSRFSTDDNTVALVKAMLDKNFSTLFTNILGQIDLNHPSAKLITTSLLKPLEFLSKQAVKMGDVIEVSAKEGVKVGPEPVTPRHSFVPHHDEHADLSDITRTSALGVFNAHESESVSEGDDDETDEEGFEDFSEDDMSDEEMTHSEDSDASENEDDDMEIVVPPNYHHDMMGTDDDDDDDDEDDDEDDADDDDDDEDDDDDLDDDLDGGESIDDDDDGMSWEDEDDDDEDGFDSESEGDIVEIGPDGMPIVDPHLVAAVQDAEAAGGTEAEEERDVPRAEQTQDENDDDDDDDEEEDFDDEDDMDEEEEFARGGMMVDMMEDGGGLIGTFGGRLGAGGARVRRVGRRQIMEFDMGPGGLDFPMLRDDGAHIFDDPTEFPPLGRSAPPRNPDDGLAHPLLVNQAPVRTRPDGRPDNRGRARGPGGMELNALDDIIGGGALQLLQEIFSRAAGTRPGVYRIEANLPMGMGGRGGGVGVPAGPSGTSAAGAPAADAAIDQVVALHAFSSMKSPDRWWQEAKMMYGAAGTEKAFKVVNGLLNAMMPEFVEEEKVRKAKEEEEKKKREEELRKRKEEEEIARKKKQQEEEEARKKKEEEEAAKKKAEEEARAKEAAERMEVEEPTPETGPSTTAPQEPERERIIVTINGNPVDISGTGIDPTFLEALPDDLRQEVLAQHVREQRANRTDQAPSAISAEFLAALPADLRAEIIREERLEEQRRQRAQQPESSTGPADIDPSAFVASLDPQLRQSIFLEADDAFLAALPPQLAAEANAVRERRQRLAPAGSTSLPFPRPGGGSSSTGAGGVPAKANTSGVPKKPVQREALQLVDRQALVTLLRLLFMPDAGNSKTVFYRLLVNLCENSKTRTELLTLLLSILSEGNIDLSAVDKSLSQLSIKTKGKSGTPRRPSSGAALGLVENIPNLVAQRCLEVLGYLASYNEAMIQFFLLENDTFSLAFTKTIKTPSSKKGKGKEKTTSIKYPIVVLLGLLERNEFLENTALMEQLTHLLSTILKTLPRLLEKALAKAAAASSSSNADNKKPGGSSTNESSSNVAGSSSNSIADNATSVDPAASISESTGNADNTKSSSEKVAEKPQEVEFKPPVIPDHCIKATVSVLTKGDCSNKTFQYLLSIMASLCSLRGIRETITSELISSAQQLGESMYESLGELAELLQVATNPIDVQGVTLSKFSPSSSQQAKTLRVLKALDYIYTRKSLVTGATTASTANSAASSTLSLTGPRPAETTGSSSAIGGGAGAGSGSGNATAASGPGAVAVKEEKRRPEEEIALTLTKIYDKLQLNPLWAKLGTCMAAISEKPDMIHIATVLLPLIEAFMVVSKPYVINKPPHQRANITVASLNRKPVSEMTNEEYFFAFTEEHRKILNTMVRNTPSLMSGSFSLLVHNPKVLEFDNKRTYFTQQLHKRTSRDHYGGLSLNVRRPYVFEDSYHQLQGRSGNEIKYGKLAVRFHDEDGVDAGGVTREWFSVLSRQMFNPDYALFRPSAVDKVTYQPNRSSWINPDHLSYFKFVGRIIGKAIYDGRLLDCYFTRSFYKHILGVSVDYKDMEAIDPEFFKSLDWILKNDITDVLDLNLSCEIDDFGQKKVVDLIPDGRNIAVTEANKHDYVRYITEMKLTTAIKDQINAFLQGFHEVIPKELISIFNEQELELLISGMPDIDIDDWKNNTEFQNYTQSAPQVQWFWRAVRSFNQEERAKLLQFITGTSKVPLEGFAQLQGSNGVQKFQIHRDFGSVDRLPSAHTCFNQLDLPQYESYEQLRTNLLLAISECGTGFGFA